MKTARFFALTAILVLTGFLNSEAQIYTGGNLGAHVNNSGYYVDVAPVVGYRYKRLDAGISPFFSYRSNKIIANRYSYGGRIFTEVTIIDNVFLHAEIEATNIDVPGSNERKWIFGIPVGAGYRKEIAPNTHAHAMILYDLLLDDDSSVNNPIVRAGVTYSF
ncbi:MAG: hypothetical protein R6V32_05570 [Bacteroidales bacterium]